MPPLDGVAIAQAWLVELVACAPLERAAELPGEGFAEDAPRLCAAVVAALGGDAALADLEPGGALATLAERVGPLARAHGAAATVEAVERLRTVAWSAITEALVRPQPAQVADLADRLAAVTSTLAAASLDAARRPDPREGPLAAVLAGADRARSAAQGAPSPPPHALPPDAEPPVGDAAAAVDDAAWRWPQRDGEPAPLPPDEPLASVEPFPLQPRAAAAPVAPDRPVVEDASSFRVARVAPWTAAIERRLARRDDGRPFAVLCVEVADLDRLVAAEEQRGIALALEEAEAAALGQLRPADALVRERPGRLWLVTPDTDHDAARALAHRIAAAVAAGSPHRGAPLEAASGVAVCPDDGEDAAVLEGRAEEALFAARAAGVRVGGPSRPA